ncbi:hypothetical protein RN001_001816 [Aquatica leii]|uniref:Uncharacterized protein n=1 Tax=Aquatica leii TaxID=1421715 RepID=A0AAN7QAN6_9COLE|nr:hypothetical protein RN001_001816 [Aquatica leii]
MALNKRVIHSQGREIIYNVYKFMLTEKEQGQLSIPLNSLRERVATATGVGLNTVKRILKEASEKPEHSKFSSPRKTINKESTKSSVDKFEEEIILRIIYTYDEVEAEYLDREVVGGSVLELIIKIGESKTDDDEESDCYSSDD